MRRGPSLVDDLGRNSALVTTEDGTRPGLSQPFLDDGAQPFPMN